jgi:electron transfer flavoprotein alpha subunit
MAGAIWTVTQLEHGEPKAVSYETIAAGQKLAAALGKPLEAVVLGAGARAAAAKVAARTVERVRVVDDQ